MINISNSSKLIKFDTNEFSISDNSEKKNKIHIVINKKKLNKFLKHKALRNAKKKRDEHNGKFKIGLFILFLLYLYLFEYLKTL